MQLQLSTQGGARVAAAVLRNFACVVTSTKPELDISWPVQQAAAACCCWAAGDPHQIFSYDFMHNWSLGVLLLIIAGIKAHADRASLEIAITVHMRLGFWTSGLLACPDARGLGCQPTGSTSQTPATSLPMST
jgi:hypothetical protein